MRPHEAAFKSQLRSSKKRGINFLLTFKEWIKIWIDSGHLHERGRGLGKYHMGRFGDKGPYAIGNVAIMLGSKNLSDANKGRKLTFTKAHLVALSKGARARKHYPHSEETKQKIRNAITGIKRSTESRLKMSKAKCGSKPNVPIKERKRRSLYLAARNKTPEMRKKVSAGLKGTTSWLKRKRNKRTGRFL